MKKIEGIVLIVMLIFVVGCTQQKQELTPVKVRLKWLHQAQFAGNYVAKDLGFYEERGLDVNLFEFNFEHWPVSQVQNKEMDFGITGADELVISKQKGNADDVKAVAVIYKISPVCLYSLAESGISKPEDLIGKTVGIERASDGSDINVGILYKVMLKNMGINDSQINDVTIGYDATELLAGETDVSSGYVINEPHQAILEGYDVNIIMTADYGANMYADVVIVHEDTIENNPELVEKFVHSTLEGWNYVIENEDEVVDYVLNCANESTREHEQYMLSNSIPLIHTGDSTLGLMKLEEWENIITILSETGMINETIDGEELFTNRFIQ